jgi:hypothetical protein
MAAVAHNTSFAKKVGIPQSVGKEFNKADKGRKLLKDATMATKKMAEGGLAKKEHQHLAAHHMTMAAHHMAAAGEDSRNPTIEKGESKRPHGEHSIQERGKTRAMEPKMSGNSNDMKKGGAVRRK